MKCCVGLPSLGPNKWALLKIVSFLTLNRDWLSNWLWCVYICVQSHYFCLMCELFITNQVDFIVNSCFTNFPRCLVYFSRGTTNFPSLSDHYSSVLWWAGAYFTGRVYNLCFVSLSSMMFDYNHVICVVQTLPIGNNLTLF